MAPHPQPQLHPQPAQVERITPPDLASNLAALFAGWPSLARELDLVATMNQEIPQ